MKTFDDLLKMDQATLLRYLEAESEAIISRASPGNQKALREIQKSCDLIRARAKSTEYAAELMTGMLLNKAQELADQLGKLGGQAN